VSQPPGEPGWPVPDQPPAQQWQPPARKPKLPLFMGILIGAVVPFFGVALPFVLPDGSAIGALAPIVWVFLVLLSGAALLFSDETRRWGVGILIGLFGMLIIGAGACVALLFVVLASYSGG
jgi:hypothetical protein